MEEMTIQELFEWAVQNKVQDYKIIIQFRDDGGDYYGHDDEVYLEINHNNKEVML